MNLTKVLSIVFFAIASVLGYFLWKGVDDVVEQEKRVVDEKKIKLKEAKEKKLAKEKFDHEKKFEREKIEKEKKELINSLREKCEALGFEINTPKNGKCVLELMR